ncbi:hypothetical protein T01_15469 [Trichinella spiralis]|uniref:Uncharacterized protein n=1 Tax=Trichinella spiralis TaxID=6334 RepID=A0A0V1BGK6_TRISP|nr:hypothetical protein T01_15469 [Trichinella spiralis]
MTNRRMDDLELELSKEKRKQGLTRLSVHGLLVSLLLLSAKRSSTLLVLVDLKSVDFHPVSQQ